MGGIPRRLCRRVEGCRGPSGRNGTARPVAPGPFNAALRRARRAAEQCGCPEGADGPAEEAMNGIAGVPRDILQRIGNTSLLPLRRIAPGDGARILLKLENENPTGSMKDRMALAMVEAAEADGRLKPGGTVVEYTGGSTGVSLALVCAVKGYPLHIVTSDAFAREKLEHMKILGAQLEIIHS